MSDFLLAIVSPATSAIYFEPPPPDWDVPVVVAASSGDGLARLDAASDCRLVVVERELEPQIVRLAQRLRRRSPGLEILLLSSPVSEAVRTDLQAARIELLDRTVPKADLLATLRHHFRRAALQARAGIVGHSPAVHAMLETILQIGPTDVPVLITGPSGAGKELVARALYWTSRRAEREFVALNVGALAESVLESELFGHEKGAFTGAVARKAGVFERADHGTLFLDEVGEMTPHMQVRLLRALDSGEITPVGGTHSLKVDVRLIAATNRALDAAVARGAFREDLYYRLKVVHVEVPGLAARRDDLPDLVQHFLVESGQLYDTPARQISEPALRLLQAYDWPGNIRELRNTVHSMAVLAKGQTLDVDAVPAALRDGSGSHLPVLLHRSPEQAEREVILQSLLALRHDLREVLELLRGEPRSRAVLVEPAGEALNGEPPSLRENEKDMIVAALTAVGGNRRRAAQRLGIAERTLYRKLKSYGLM